MPPANHDVTLNTIANQLSILDKTIDLRLRAIETNITNNSALQEERLNFLKCTVSNLQTLIKDHEDRLRVLDDSAISLKASFTLIQGLQATLTIIAASIAAWLGRIR
jgi:hypothetical protein